MVSANMFEYSGNGCSIRIPASLDNAGMAIFRDVCRELPESVEIFEIDMVEFREMGVASLSMLFVLLQEVAASVQIRLVNCSASVFELLHKHGFQHMISICRADQSLVV